MSAYLYFIGAIDNGRLESVKIGITSDDPKKRLSTLQTGNHRKLTLMHTVQAGTSIKAHELESRLHRKFKKQRQTGEWFEMSGELAFFLTKIVPHGYTVESNPAFSGFYDEF